jgi:hypothetical protein
MKQPFCLIPQITIVPNYAKFFHFHKVIGTSPNSISGLQDFLYQFAFQ